jgi:hypothetical protein
MFWMLVIAVLTIISGGTTALFLPQTVELSSAKVREPLSTGTSESVVQAYSTGHDV